MSNMVTGEIILDVYAHRAYHHNIYFNHCSCYTEEEKRELLNELKPTDQFINNLKMLLIYDYQEHQLEINDLTTYEKDGLLFMKFKISFKNLYHYTADKLSQEIRENMMHYFKSGWNDYGDYYLYKYKESVDRDNPMLESDVEIFEKANESNPSELLKEYNESKSSWRQGYHKCQYSYHFHVDQIHFDDDDNLNKYGTEVDQTKRKCDKHNYYYYLYENSSMRELYSSGCLGDDSETLISLDDLIRQTEDELEIPLYSRCKYYKITDNQHNILYNKCINCS